jgi:hypothetical protein
MKLQRKRELFADPEGFAWHQRTGCDVLLDNIAAEDWQAVERIAWNLFRQASYVEARVKGGGYV